MRLLQVALALGIVVAALVAISGIADIVNAFVFGSAVSAVTYIAGTRLRPGPKTSIWETADTDSKTDD